MYALTDYDYDLPDDLIARNPVAVRDQSRLLCLNRTKACINHHVFHDIVDLLDPQDVLVLNNTEVIPGRLLGRKETGGRVEVLILDYGAETLIFKCLLKASKMPAPGSKLYFEKGLSAQVLSKTDALFKLKFSYAGNFEELIYQIGHLPLPPYLRRDADTSDQYRYQTVYAECRGAIAAPTAGLHFTAELLQKIRNKGIEIVAITLHVGYGTFMPVRTNNIKDHKMHCEHFEIKNKAAKVINQARAKGGRVVAVGTTCVRTLEFAADNNGKIHPGNDNCDLFIYPGYKFKAVDVILTNFHLPKTTLLMLVAAFSGRKKIMETYQTAVKQAYRFYSYGDAMLIL